MIRQALLMAAKDTRVFLKDRFAVAFALLFPFVFVLGFGAALGGVGPADERLEFVVASREETGIAADLVRGLASDPALEIRQLDYDEAYALVRSGELDGFVAFPPDFTARVTSGQQAVIEVVSAAGSPDARAALVSLADAIASRTAESTVVAAAALDLGVFDPSLLQGLPPDAGLLNVEVERVGDVRPFNASNLTLPGYLTMFVFFAAALGAESIARERQTHTLERLLANGVDRGGVVLGKMLGGVYRGVLQLAVLWGVGLLILRIDLGAAPAAMIAVSGLMVLASAAFGVMLASFVKTTRSASVDRGARLAHAGAAWGVLVAAVHRAVVAAGAGEGDAARLGERRVQQGHAIRRGDQRRVGGDGRAGCFCVGVPRARAHPVPPGAVRRGMTV